MTRIQPVSWTFLAAFLLSATVSLVPIWSVRYPPMVDLPQHAAQVFVWKHLDDPAFGYRQIFEIDLASPYLAGHAVARLAAVLLPVPAAMKCLVSLAVLALPLALFVLLRRSESDEWNALLGFPLAFGFAFYWGFTNYMLAVPVGLAFTAAALGYARRPSRRSGLALALFAFVLYFFHALAFALSIAVAGLWILTASKGRFRERLLLAWPLAPATVVIAAWFLLLRFTDPSQSAAVLWSETAFERLRDLPSMLAGAGRQQGPRLLGGLLVLGLPLAGGRWSWRPPWRLAPLAVALGLFFAAPNRALNTWFLYPRFAVFIALFALLAMEPARHELRRRAGRMLIVAFVIGWAAFLTADFRAIDAEARHFDAVVESMEGGRRLLGLVFEPGFDAVAGMPVFGHFHMWYQAKKGGLAEFTFATSAPNPVQYLPGAGPLADPRLSTRPDLFDFHRDGRFDYFLVRSPDDVGGRLFRGAPVELELRSGNWWLYRRSPDG